MSELSVIVVSYQSGPGLLLVLRNLLSSATVSEVVLVDNGNAPSLLEQLRGLDAAEARLKIISGHGNIGFAAACNLGVERARGNLICLMQADVFINDDALSMLSAALSSQSEAIIAPLLLNADGSEQKGGRMRFMTTRHALNEATRLYMFSRNAERAYLHSTPQPEGLTSVEAVGFACVAMPRATFQRLGGLDPQYFLHFADMDFCRRANAAGVSRFVLPEAVAVHLRHSSREGIADHEWQRRKSFQRYITQHGGAMSVPMQWALKGLTALWLLAKLVRIRVGKYLPESSGLRAARRVQLLYSHLLKPDVEQTLAGQTVLLSGATNQVGTCVLGRLLAQGAQVVAVTHQTQVPFHHARLIWRAADLRAGRLELGEYKPELMIHAADLWLLPPAMPAIAGSSIKRVIAFGSAKVFAKVYAAHSREQAEIERLEQAEINAVKACRANGIRWTIFRPTMIYGVGLDHTIMRIADAARRFGFVLIDPPARGRRQPVHADDLAQAVTAAMAEKKTLDKAYNLSGGEVLEYRAMIERIMAALGRRPRLIEAPILPDLLDRLGRFLGKSNLHGEHLRQMNQDMTLPYIEARTDFGYNPRPFLSGGAADLGQF